MDLFASYFLANMLVLILEKEGNCLSVVSDSKVSDRPSEAEQAKRVAHREKRCSCENLRDKECVFFCHIGIVWVNTPRQVVPYGEGSFPARMKRNVERCVCAYTSDSGCLQFCSASKLRQEYVGLTRMEKMFPVKSIEKYDRNMEQMGRKSISTQKT